MKLMGGMSKLARLTFTTNHAEGGQLAAGPMPFKLLSAKVIGTDAVAREVKPIVRGLSWDVLNHVVLELDVKPGEIGQVDVELE